jgi:hypothetical protein
MTHIMQGSYGYYEDLCNWDGLGPGAGGDGGRLRVRSFKKQLLIGNDWSEKSECSVLFVSGTPLFSGPLRLEDLV